MANDCQVSFRGYVPGMQVREEDLPSPGVGEAIVERVAACVRFDGTVQRLLERTSYYELGTDQEPELPFF